MKRLASLCGALFGLAACGGDSNRYEQQPAFIAGQTVRSDYDGERSGLVTGQARSLATLLTYAVPIDPAPGAAELRTLALQNSYYGLLDVSPTGGFGNYFGVLDARANQGSEYRAYADDGSGRENVLMVVQISSHFNPDRPCIVSATASGSRGVYSEVSTVGEWALNKGCAVAYSDKGGGAAAYDLDRATGYTMDAQLVPVAGRRDVGFNPTLGGASLDGYRAANPHRFALKHLHSQRNPERDWGRYTLQSIEFALYALNRHFPDHAFRPSNTLVIAASISNGAGAALLAAEQDGEELIDGVAVVEPQINLPDNAAVSVQRGDRVVSGAGKPVFDYMTFANLYQPCAVLAASIGQAPTFVDPQLGANRCAGLARMGLLRGASLADQASDALAKLHGYGWEAESDILHDAHYGFEFTSLVASAYASAYSRAPVSEAPCGYSVGGVPAHPVALMPGAPGAPDGAALQLFGATGSGLAAGALMLVNDRSPGGAVRDTMSLSASSGKQDYNLDGAACLRRLFTGAAVGNSAPDAAELAQAARVATGMGQIRASARLHGKPAIIVHGRADTLIPVNHTSRPYAALNKRLEPDSALRYYEVTDAQHFDALVSYYPRTLVPLHVYGMVALDLMFEHLRSGAALPPSQAVRAVARSSPTAILIGVNLPAVQVRPQPGDRIEIAAGSISVPD